VLVTINLEIEEIQRIITALQCACAVSDENGHAAQTKRFRDLYEKLQKEIE
jgi:hypothetical protein